MESPILGWNASSWVRAGENVLDSIPSPAMAIRGSFFRYSSYNLSEWQKEIDKVEAYAYY